MTIRIVFEIVLVLGSGSKRGPAGETASDLAGPQAEALTVRAGPVRLARWASEGNFRR